MVQLTELDSARKETGHWHPYFLPDGRHFLFLARSSMPEHDAIYFASLDSKERTRLVGSTVKAAFAPPDRLLFTRGTALMAQRFDAERGVLAGDPVQIVEQVGMNATSGAAGFSVSANGLLAHRLGRVSRSPDTVLTWFDRTGKPIGTLGDPAGHRNPRISPDGTRVVVERSDDAISSVDLWLLDMARKVPTKLTFAAANFGNVAPLWSPDGTRVAWQSRITAGAPPTIFHKRIGGTAKDEKIRLLPGASSIDDWAGEMGILFHDGGIPPRAPGLQILPLDGGEPRMLGAARTILTHARMSPEPDRRWIAYTSSDTGRPEIYVQNFPTPTESIPVSANGGIQPLWRRDGRELFFLAPDGTLMAAPIQVSPRLAAGEPVALFPTRVEGGGTMSPGIWHQDDITHDGRFLINTLVQDQSTPSTFPTCKRARQRSRTFRHHANRRAPAVRASSRAGVFPSDELSQKEMLSLIDLYGALGEARRSHHLNIDPAPASECPPRCSRWGSPTVPIGSSGRLARVAWDRCFSPKTSVWAATSR